jgi:hypothetical protein
MITFKEFLSEAKKQKEPDWPDADYNSGYSRLRDMQAHLTDKPSKFRLQLFVPKHRDPELMAKYKRDREWNQLKREFPDEIKEASIPILTSYREAPPGDNKPAGAFWTSSAITKPNGEYTSKWYEYVKTTFRDWQTDYGYLFEIDHSASVYDSSHLEQFYDWAESLGRLSSELLSDYAAKNRDFAVRSQFPWDVMARHFDGVHHTYGYGGSSDLTYGWDVESTAWFNTGVLKYKGAVKLWHGNEDEED